MRRFALAAVAVLALVAPVAAQPSFTEEQVAAATGIVKGANLTPELSELMWCSAAFGTLKDVFRSNGQGDAAAQLEQLHRTTTTRAAESAVAAGIAQADYDALAAAFTVYTGAQVAKTGGAADYSEEQCIAAAR